MAADQSRSQPATSSHRASRPIRTFKSATLAVTPTLGLRTVPTLNLHTAIVPLKANRAHPQKGRTSRANLGEAPSMHSGE